MVRPELGTGLGDTRMRCTVFTPSIREFCPNGQRNGVRIGATRRPGTVANIHPFTITLAAWNARRNGADMIETVETNPRPMTAAARDVATILRENADRADRDSRLTEQAVTALRDAGLFRLGVPAAVDGHEAGLATCVEVVSELARACPSSAWVVAVSYGAQFMGALFGETVRQELWGQSPDVVMCGAFRGANVTATPVPGGQRVTGRWSWMSGVSHSQWTLLGIPVMDAEGGTLGQAMAVVPVTDVSIEDTWNMVGMRGTGSNTVVADEVFVPAERIKPFGDIVGGGPRTSVEPLYRIPVGSLALTLAAALLGATRAIFDTAMGLVAAGKPMANSVYPHLAESPGVRANVATAATLIDSAELHLLRSARELDHAAATGADIDLTVRARARMDTGHASTCLREAARLLLNVSGASSFSRTNPVQRYWRDLETGAHHPLLSAELSQDIYGRALVGAPSQASHLI